MIGANNALGSVSQLKVAWSEDGYDDLDKANQYTVWRPIHFKDQLDQVVKEVKQIRADTLISDPPRSLSSNLEWLEWLDQNLGVFMRLLRIGN